MNERNERRFYIVSLLIVGLLAAIGNIQAINASNDAQRAAEQAERAVAQVKRFTVELRDSSVSGCKRQNEVRKALRTTLKEQIVSAQGTDPHLFPNIPPDEFQRLLAERITSLENQIKAIPNAPCERIYPRK